jgi:hypothetical protein
MVVWYTPGVAKSPRMLRSSEIYLARHIGDNPDSRVLLKIIDRVDPEFTIVLLWGYGNIQELVEMRVLLESETPITPKAAEIPKNFR